MRKAIELSIENVANGGGPFGAVIAKNGEIIATGVNRVTASCDPTAHAEVSAIRAAAAKLGTFDLSGYEIYTDNNITKKITDSNITTANIYIGKKSSTVLYIRAYNIVKGKKLYSKASKRYVFLDN